MSTTDSTTPTGADPDRLIPEDELRAALARDSEGSSWWHVYHSDRELLDIAEARLLLGERADTDRLSGDLFLRVVRRLVAVERQLAGIVQTRDVRKLP